ncbi:MAG: J domain-containing protein [Thermoplasmata archaeon]|nr:J domain-containing protein [Thermoplasmata archaeon]
MKDRTLKGLTWEFIAYIVLMLFTAAVSYLSLVAEDAMQDMMISMIVLLLLPGIGLLFAGRFYLLLGARKVGNVALTFVSLMLVVSVPFVFMVGAMSGPAAVVIISFSFGLPFVAMALPYLKLGGKVPAILSMIMGMFTGLIILISIESAVSSLPFFVLGVPLILIFLSLDTACLIAMIGRRRDLKGEDDEILLAPVPSVPNPFRQPRPAPTEAQRAVKPPNPGGFKVVEREAAPPMERGEPVQTFEEFVTDRRRTVSVHEEDVYITRGDLFIAEKDFYQVLRIPRGANHIEIKRAYRRMALLYHPDKNRDDMGPLYAEALREEMRKVNKAKEHLLDERRRREYDLKLAFIKKVG